MVFNEDKSSGDIIASQDWDDFVDFAESISSNILTWRKVSGLSDITPSSPTQGQVLAWDTTLSKYTPSTITIAGTTNLSAVTINTHKGWSSYGITGLSYLSSQTISGSLKSDSLLFPDTTTRIFRTGDDLQLDSEDDIIINPDDNIEIKIDGTSYARFAGNEKSLYISKDGSVIDPNYNLQVRGSISGTSILSDSISGSIISGTRIFGVWSGNTIHSKYIMSSSKYSDIYLSGTKYTEVYNWMVNSGAQYTNILESGTKYTQAYSWMVNSGASYSQAYASAQIAMYSIVHADDIDDGAGGGWDSNAFNNSGIKWDGSNWVPMPSGGSGGGGGGTPGGINAGDVQYRQDASTFDGETAFNYDEASNTLKVYHLSSISISTQVISGGAWSGAIIASKYLMSSSKYSDVYTWYSNSSVRISEYVASGDEYSTAYTERGSQIGGDELTWDGFTLNVDDKFIRNDADDTTTGVITSAGLDTTGYVSAQNVSGGSIKGTWTGDTIRNAYLTSGSEFQSAYDWYSDSSSKLTDPYTWYTESSNKLSTYVASGEEYSFAYASAQALKRHAFHEIISSQYIDDYIASSNVLANFYGSGLGASHSYISGLTDVAEMTSKSDGDILTYDTTQSKWSSQAFSGTPAGGDHYVQFNNAGSFGGDTSFTWNDTTNTLRISGAISGGAISGGTINTRKIIILGGTDGIQFINDNTKIYESLNDLHIQSEDDIFINPDDNVAIRKEGNSYAQFFGDEKSLLISNDGSIPTPTYTLEVRGSISGTSILSNAISGINISGGTIIGTWNGDSITSAYIIGYIASSTAVSRFADSSNINARFVASSTANSKFMHSGISYVSISSQYISGGSIKGAWAGDSINLGYIDSGSQLNDLLSSGNEYSQAYASAQIAMYEIKHAGDIDDGALGGWDSVAFTNSGMLWDGSNWVPMPSGGSGGGGANPAGSAPGDVQYRQDATTFDAESIFNYNEDTDTLRLYHLSSLSVSSQTISGGSIRIGSLVSDITPDADNQRDLGDAAHEFKNLYVDGTGYIDTIEGIDSDITSMKCVTLEGITIQDSQDSTTNMAFAGALGTYILFTVGNTPMLNLEASDTWFSSNAISGSSLKIGDRISEIRYGWGSVSDAGTITHNCSSKPSWVGLTPSGTVPIMYSFTVDTSNITVYHSDAGSRTFSWRAIV